MNVIVTGGAGFIGSHLIERLIQKKWKITLIDNFEDFLSTDEEKLNNISPLEENCFIVKEDIKNFKKMIRYIPKDRYDLIIHLAAKAGVRTSINRIDEYQETNVTGTKNILELARKLWIRKVVFASSSSVYGYNPNLPWEEKEQLMPMSPYAYTKIACEALGHVYYKLYGIKFISLRFFSVYGPRQRPDLVIRQFIERIKEKKEIKIYGDGTSRRDYTYISDVIDGIMKAAEYTQTPYEIFNIGNGQTISINEIIKLLESKLQIKAIVKYEDEKPGDAPVTCANIDKSKEILKFNPKISLEEGIEKTIKSYI